MEKPLLVKMFISGLFVGSNGRYGNTRYTYHTLIPEELESTTKSMIKKYGDKAKIEIATPYSANAIFGVLMVENTAPDFNTKFIPYRKITEIFNIKLEKEKTIMNKSTILFDDYANTVFNLKGTNVQLREGVLTEVEKETKVYSLPAELKSISYESPEDVEVGTVFEHKQHTYIVTGTLPLLESFDEAGNRLVMPYPVKNIFAKVSAINVEAILKENITAPYLKAVDSEMVEYVNDNFEKIKAQEKAQKNEILSSRLGAFLGLDLKKNK